MIAFNYETDFTIDNEEELQKWITSCAEEDGFEIGEINYIFCDDAYLHKINVEFLQHDTLTDIISFDYTLGKLIGGDIFISIPRVEENAKTFNVSFKEELHRVMIHGVLHYMGFKDKTDDEKQLMRDKENSCLKTVNL
ncbi:rRNA maturation RNase YbeY [Tenacibaculum sp. MEBiC06402]|uniref:rRNA maturation RNase YbeY n=1 Tax=unclassified Tenacibaculum TaxID=2635139 RepID=UPI003B9CB335